MTTFANLKTYAKDRYHDATDTKATREIGRFVNDAFRRISRAHDWSFYLDRGRVNTAVKYNTGTVAMVNGASVITLSGGTFPLDVASSNASIVINTDTSIEFNVKTRDSGTQVTVADGQSWLGASTSGAAYSLYYYKYSLPTNFVRMYDHEFQDFFANYLVPTEFEIYKLTNQASEGDPSNYTISGDKEIRFWPFPSRAVAMDFLYYRRPNVLSTDGDTMDWVEDWIDLAHRAIDLEIALRENKNPGDAHAAFMGTLVELKSLDTGRQFARNHHRTLGSAASQVSNRLIKRGAIS